MHADSALEPTSLAEGKSILPCEMHAVLVFRYARRLCWHETVQQETAHLHEAAVVDAVAHVQTLTGAASPGPVQLVQSHVHPHVVIRVLHGKEGEGLARSGEAGMLQPARPLEVLEAPLEHAAAHAGRCKREDAHRGRQLERGIRGEAVPYDRGQSAAQVVPRHGEVVRPAVRELPPNVVHLFADLVHGRFFVVPAHPHELIRGNGPEVNEFGIALVVLVRDGIRVPGHGRILEQVQNALLTAENHGHCQRVSVDAATNI